jgi:predicted Zn-dependent protease
MRFLTKIVVSLVVLALAAGGAASLLGPGCGVVEKAADTMADATAGTGVSSLLRGTARAAESFRDYSPAQEHYIGRAVAAQVLARYRMHPDAKLQDYVQLVGHAVLAAPETRKTFKGYRFVVLDGGELQAVSAPGGFVFVTEGTVRRARDEDELAAVLAHEVAHVSLKHGIQAIKAATRKRSFALLVQGAGQTGAEVSRAGGAGAKEQQVVELAGLLGDAVQDITTDLLVKGYSREQELEADRTAAQYLESSGYARAALESYLSRLAGEGSGGGGGWFATHPSPQDRVAELGAAPGGLSPDRALRAQRFTALVAPR